MANAEPPPRQRFSQATFCENRTSACRDQPPSMKRLSHDWIPSLGQQVPAVPAPGRQQQTADEPLSGPILHGTSCSGDLIFSARDLAKLSAWNASPNVVHSPEPVSVVGMRDVVTLTGILSKESNSAQRRRSAALDPRRRYLGPAVAASHCCQYTCTCFVYKYIYIYICIECVYTQIAELLPFVT